MRQRRSRKRPTHNVMLTHKVTKARSVAGVGWEQEWGFGIVLNPGVVLDWRMCDEYFITLRLRDPAEPETSKEMAEHHPKEPVMTSVVPAQFGDWSPRRF